MEKNNPVKGNWGLCLYGALLGSLAGVGFPMGQLPVETGESWSQGSVGVKGRGVSLCLFRW